MIELNITGMSCSHCRAAVASALEKVPGVEQVSVDLGSGTAEITGQASVAELLAAVEAEGYQASPAA